MYIYIYIYTHTHTHTHTHTSVKQLLISHSVSLKLEFSIIKYSHSLLYYCIVFVATVTYQLTDRILLDLYICECNWKIETQIKTRFVLQVLPIVKKYSIYSVIISEDLCTLKFPKRLVQVSRDSKTLKIALYKIYNIIKEG